MNDGRANRAPVATIRRDRVPLSLEECALLPAMVGSINAPSQVGYPAPIGLILRMLEIRTRSRGAFRRLLNAKHRAPLVPDTPCGRNAAFAAD